MASNKWALFLFDENGDAIEVAPRHSSARAPRAIREACKLLREKVAHRVDLVSPDGSKRYSLV